MENKLLDQFNDIFQEIFDDFPELQFELSFHGPGLMKYISKNIDADMITPPLRYDRVRKMAVDYAKRLEPYLRESNDRLSDIGFQCSYNPNENVRLLNKMTMEYDIVICIRQIKRNESYVKNWKSFRTINEIIEFKNIKYNSSYHFNYWSYCCCFSDLLWIYCFNTKYRKYFTRKIGYYSWK